MKLSILTTALLALTATAQDKDRPNLYTTNYEQRIELAKQQGKPIIYWIDTTPGENKDSDVFFTTLGEAVHVLNNEHPSFKGQTKGVVFHGKDGYDYWIKPKDLHATTADKVRTLWEGELDKQKVRNTKIPLTTGGEVTLEKYIAQGGSVPLEWCKEAGFSQGEIEFIKTLQPTQAALQQYQQTPQQYVQPQAQRPQIQYVYIQVPQQGGYGGGGGYSGGGGKSYGGGYSGGGGKSYGGGYSGGGGGFARSGGIGSA